jgi:hypothetical protein
MSEMGYKYWVAFEVRCLDTDKRLFKNHSVFLTEPMKDETGISLIEERFRDDLEQHSIRKGEPSNFQVKLTCWPHYLGHMERPKETPKEVAPQRQKEPGIYLAVNNVNVDEIIH